MDSDAGRRRAAAAGERGGGMREPGAREGAGRARRRDGGAGAFPPLHHLSALVLQVAEAGGCVWSSPSF